MLDSFAIRVFSGIFAVLALVGTIAISRHSRALGGGFDSVRAARPTGVLFRQIWELSILLPFVFFFIGATVPSWVYGTPLNFAFPGGQFVQIAALPLWFAGGTLALWSGRALGRYMVVQIAVLPDHELVTQGPYARIRHPAYTAVILMTAASALFYVHVVLIIDALLVIAIARARARREEDLLSSPEGFGARYREYMERTGRFIPRWR